MIETRKVERRYGQVVAVSDLDLCVERGEIYGFLGPNGAGKTTTIRMIVGLLRPSAGQVLVAGHDVVQEPLEAKAMIGYLAQQPYLYKQLTGREFLRFAGGLYGLSDDEIDNRSDKLLALLELEDKADQQAAAYSGGMRHKLGLCAALLHRPQVLVLDEPLAGLDPSSARRVKDLLHELAGQGVTVFLSTHVLEVAERVCHRVGILNRGRLIAEGGVDSLRQQLQTAGDATLEDLFLQLTATADQQPLADSLV